MIYLFLSIAFILGLAVGSFLNVLSIRYQAGGRLLTASVRAGRSHCMGCQKELVWYELIPLVSFLIQRGKCRSCGAKLTWQYPIVEFFTAATFAGIACHLYKFLNVWQAPSVLTFPAWYYAFFVLWAAAFSALILIALIDMRLSLIPDQINFFILGLGFLYIGFQLLFDKFGPLQGSFLDHHALLFGLRSNVWVNHFAGLIAGSILFGLIIFITKGRAMGMGDLKLGAVLGFLFGWPDIALIVMLAFIVGAIWAMLLMARGKKHLKDAVPFGPFLVVASYAVFFAGFYIMEGYFNLFSFY